MGDFIEDCVSAFACLFFGCFWCLVVGCGPYLLLGSEIGWSHFPLSGRFDSDTLLVGVVGFLISISLGCIVKIIKKIW